MFSIFNHVMKSVRDTNIKPELPVVLPGKSKAVYLT